MENASKALMITGGVLLGLVIISLAVRFYAGLNRESKELAKKPEVVDLQTYNSKLEQYRGRENITAQEIISVYNYVKENENKMPYKTTVKVNNSVKNFKKEDDKIKFIKNNNGKKYKCTFLSNYVLTEDVGQVTCICFTEYL